MRRFEFGSNLVQNRKVHLHTFIGFTALTLIVSGTVAGQNLLQVVADRVYSPHDTSSFGIVLRNSSKIRALNFVLKYDPNVIRPVTVVPSGQVLRMNTANGNRFLKDKISFVVFDDGDNTIAPGSSEIFRVKFVAADTTRLRDTTTLITFHQALAVDPNLTTIPFKFINGRLSGLALPVRLIAFEAKKVDNGRVMVRWATSSEVSNNGFYVQRRFAADAKYVDISRTFIQGHGTTNEVYQYGFSDSVKLNAIYYYRLRIVSSNGRQSYSRATVLNLVSSMGENLRIDDALILNSGKNEKSSPGKWQPILLPSGSSIHLPNPPAAGSKQFASEMNDLRAMQSLRNTSIVEAINYWDSGACIRWNEIARKLVIKHKTTPPMASRVYALLSVAQYDALLSAEYNKSVFKRSSPSKSDRRLIPVGQPSGSSYPSEQGAITSASAAVLTYLYPSDSDSLQMLNHASQESRLWAGMNYPSDISSGDLLGRLAAQQAIIHAKSDGSDSVWQGSVPKGLGLWYSSIGKPPLLPRWGSVKPWLMRSVTDYPPPLPPAYSSPEFKAALAEVRTISDRRTTEQLRIARYWADGAGTYTPPGHWNDIACSLIVTTRLDELHAARVLSLMNMAVMDAGICCWDAKYKFWLIRPSQADPSITTPVMLPNFPSYSSGHSSFSGAAAEVLAYFFPEQKAKLEAMAEEAAVSRLYGGIHYRFDNNVGLMGGKMMAELAIERARRDGK